MTTSGDGIKDDLRNTYLSFQFELRKHVRRRRVIIVAALAVLVPLIFYTFIPDTATEFAANGMRFLSVLIVISGAMFAGDAVCGEFEKKTSLLSFPTPQRRMSIFAGKYMAALAATWLVVSIYYVVIVVQMSHLYGLSEIPGELGKSFFSGLVYATSVVSVIFVFSSLLGRSISATILGFVSLMLILPVASSVLSRLEVEPWFVVTYSAELIYSVLGEGGLSFGPGQHFRSTMFEPSFLSGIAVMLAYTVVGFLGSMAVAVRRGVE
jgi:ABC-type transport system involved in multi-copper enzyme maturation permease subunit